jgi:hypothetical protein
MERSNFMLYFIKDNRLHRYPVSKRCGARHEQEPLRDSILQGVEECAYCLHYWPGDKDNPTD